MKSSPAARRDPLDKGMRTRLARVNSTQQSAVGYPGGAAEHARRVRRPAAHLGRRATRRRPGRRGREHHVHHQRRERQCHETSDECGPLDTVAEPQHAGDDVGQQEEGHVDAADDHFPPRRLRQLHVLLQPDSRDDAEEQPTVGGGLKLPQGGRAEQICCASAEVVEHQHQCERQPVTNDRQHRLPSTDARRDQAGADVDQQPFPVESQSVGDGSVDHHRGPAGDRDATGHHQSVLPDGRVDRGSDNVRRDGLSAGADRAITNGAPDSPVGCH